MPILEVEIVASSDDAVAAPLAQRVADATGPAFCADPARVWVRVRRLAREQYAENDSPRDETSPVFVRILQRDLPLGAARREQVAALTSAIAYACDRDESCVHLLFEPPAAGRASFGGTLIDEIE